ncbi:hypothetical protein Tco_1216073 [Tanacetum coccineum]
MLNALHLMEDLPLPIQGVAHKTNVSRPQPRSNQMKDKVVPNTSHVKFKKTEVEEHPRISSISNQTKSVTACNNSLNSRTSNVNARTSKAWKWWIAQQCPSAYTWVPETNRKWVPKVRNESVTKKIVQLILFIIDSGCTKHMTGNLSLLCNSVEKYLGTVRFSNNQFAPILGYGDLVQGHITLKRSYKLKGNDLLTGNRGTDLYTNFPSRNQFFNSILSQAKASPTQA